MAALSPIKSSATAEGRTGGPGLPSTDAKITRVRRPVGLSFYLRTVALWDLGLVLEAAPCESRREELVAVSLLDGTEQVITESDLKALLTAPSDRWIPVAELMERHGMTPDNIESLADRGLLLSDRPDAHSTEKRARDQRLSAIPWNRHAAQYHFLSKWSDQTIGQNTRDPEIDAADPDFALRNAAIVDQTVARYGKPPPAFHQVTSPLESVSLPIPKRDERIFRLLEKRSTTRVFDDRQPMSRDQLTTILYYTYGCHGYCRTDGGVATLKKTSPSGGSLHPIEVYPLVLNVEDLPAGLYHYSVRRHALDMLRGLSTSEAESLAVQCTAGQTWAAGAHALFIMTARFQRNFWKYRYHKKSYKVLMMDAAHLSQTLYLICAELDLGAFYTAAINDVDIEGVLELDPFEEGPVGIAGCGTLRDIGLDSRIRSYDPCSIKNREEAS